jgi:TonB family protein
LRSAWAVAGVIAFGIHVPIAFALLENDAATAKAPPAASPPIVSIDLESWQPPRLRPEARSKPARALAGARASGPRAQPVAPRSVAPKAQRASPIPDRPAERTPAARGLALVDAIESGALEPAGESRGGDRTRGGTGSGAASGARAFALGEVDVAPRRISGGEPAYPRLEASAGREGAVTLRFVVREDGSVSEIEVEEHRGASAFVEAATEAVRGWRFSPARRSGRVVACVCLQRLSFHGGAR